jgi:hypothetical protein
MLVRKTSRYMVAAFTKEPAISIRKYWSVDQVSCHRKRLSHLKAWDW